MATYTEVKQKIQQWITSNANREITAQVMRDMFNFISDWIQLDNFVFIYKCLTGFTFAELSQITDTQLLLIQTFRCKDDGRIKWWKYEQSNTEEANGGTIVVTSSGKRLIAEDNYVTVTPQVFGVKGDSTFAYLRNQIGAFAGQDDALNFQKAINFCLKTGRPLHVPIGWYRFGSPIVVTNATGLTMFGEGSPIEISIAEYNTGIDEDFKGVVFMRDYTGDPIFTFRGGLNSSDGDWSSYRDGKMWKSNISNIGFAERGGGNGQPNPTLNTSSLVLAKRSILMRFNNCLFVGASTSNFEGFLIDDSIFYDCRFISGGGRIASPNVLLHRTTTLSGETVYDATNSLYFFGCIWEGNRGQNILVTPSSYTRADSTVFVESGTFSALQIVGGVAKFPRLDNTCSTLNNCEFNNVGGGIFHFGLSHKGNIDNTSSSVTEIIKFFNCFNITTLLQLEKLSNTQLNMTRFVTLQGASGCSIHANCFDSSQGISGSEAVFVSNSGGNNNEVFGTVSVQTGSRRLTNKGWVKYSYSDGEPTAITNQATSFFDALGKFGWKKMDIDGVTAYVNKFDDVNAIGVTWTLPNVTTKIVGQDTTNVFTKQNTFEGTIEASGGIGRGFWVKPNIKATANNDFLYGFVLEPSYDAGAFTGVTKISQIRLNNGTLQIVGSSATIEYSSDGNEIYFNGNSQNKYINATGAGSTLNLRSYTSISIFGFLSGASARIAQFFATSGNLLLQDGGSFTDIPSAKLAINSTSKGFLTPRMTTMQRDAISSPEKGLEIFNTTVNKKQFYNGTSWETITSS